MSRVSVRELFGAVTSKEAPHTVALDFALTFFAVCEEGFVRRLPP